jgi:hypothetical protein
MVSGEVGALQPGIAEGISEALKKPEKEGPVKMGRIVAAVIQAVNQIRIYDGA